MPSEEKNVPGNCMVPPVLKVETRTALLVVPEGSPLLVKGEDARCASYGLCAWCGKELILLRLLGCRGCSNPSYSKS